MKKQLHLATSHMNTWSNFCLPYSTTHISTFKTGGLSTGSSLSRVTAMTLWIAQKRTSSSLWIILSQTICWRRFALVKNRDKAINALNTPHHSTVFELEHHVDSKTLLVGFIITLIKIKVFRFHTKSSRENLSISTPTSFLTKILYEKWRNVSKPLTSKRKDIKKESNKGLWIFLSFQTSHMKLM